VREVGREFRESPLERRIVEAVSALEQEMVDSEVPAEAVRHVYSLIEATRGTPAIGRAASPAH